jgi:hypothetical protein
MIEANMRVSAAPFTRLVLHVIHAVDVTSRRLNLHREAVDDIDSISNFTSLTII